MEVSNTSKYPRGSPQSHRRQLIWAWLQNHFLYSQGATTHEIVKTLV